MADVPTNPAPEAPAPAPAPAAGGDVIRDQDKIMLILSYLGILSLIPLLTVKDSDYVKFHAKQGLALAICSVAVFLVAWIPIIGQILACVVWLAVVVITIMSIVKAFKPERWRIPVVSSLADKF
jgi:uncharacterized membrane protein